MGREIRRVPLDFDWPIDKVWDGFLNPHGGPCPAAVRGECFDGYTAGRKWLYVIANLLSVAGGDAASPGRRGIWPHPYLQELPFGPSFQNKPVGPTPDLAALTTALAGRPPSDGLGHDACDRWSIEKKIIAAAGFDPETWGVCPTCGGDGDDPAQRAAAEAWKATSPPKGDAYQLWSTTTEGHPMSPPKASPEELARWLADNGASTFGYETASYATWLSFIRGPGWAPTAMSDGRTLVSGVEAICSQPAQPEKGGQ